MKTFSVELEGITPLMHHRMTEETLLGLLGAKDGKKAPKVVRTPRQIADDHAYRNLDGAFCIPTSYISGAFSYTASDYKQKNSGRRSIKAIAGGIFRPMEEFATLLDNKNKPLKSFEVDIKKGNNHKAGAVCVCRPRFDRWKTKFTVAVDDTVVTPETVLQILEDSGRRCGIGSFRVSKSGFYGQFQVTEWKPIKA